jgi:hypothetical protein
MPSFFLFPVPAKLGHRPAQLPVKRTRESNSIHNWTGLTGPLSFRHFSPAPPSRWDRPQLSLYRWHQLPVPFPERRIPREVDSHMTSTLITYFASSFASSYSVSDELSYRIPPPSRDTSLGFAPVSSYDISERNCTWIDKRRFPRKNFWMRHARLISPSICAQRVAGFSYFPQTKLLFNCALLYTFVAQTRHFLSIYGLFRAPIHPVVLLSSYVVLLVFSPRSAFFFPCIPTQCRFIGSCGLLFSTYQCVLSLLLVAGAARFAPPIFSPSTVSSRFLLS